MKTYCDSLDCPDGLALIAGASDVQCKRFKCTEAECCATACSSFDCPTNLVLVEDSDTTVCADSGCTEDLCCEMGKTYFEILIIGLTRSRHVVTNPLELAASRVYYNMVSTEGIGLTVPLASSVSLKASPLPQTTVPPI